MAEREVNIWIRLRDRASKVLRKVRRQFPLLHKAIKRMRVLASRAWAGMIRGAQMVTRWLKRMLVVAVIFGTYMAKQFVGAVIKAGAEAERFAMQLRQISDSAKQAEEDMQWVRRFAAKTPFYTQEVVTAFNMLRAIGVKEIKAVITASGDAAFLMGRDITAVSMAFISLHRRVWRRLGIDLDRTGKKVKISSASMKIAVERDLESIRAGLLKVLVASFGGAMKNAERTWTGMTALFWSEWWEFKVKISESGVFGFIKAGLSEILRFVNSSRRSGALDKWAMQISDAMMSIINRSVSVVDFFENLVTVVRLGARYISFALKVAFAPINLIIISIGALGRALGLIPKELDDIQNKLIDLLPGESDIDKIHDAYKNVWKTARAGGKLTQWMVKQHETLTAVAKTYADSWGKAEEEVRAARDAMVELKGEQKETLTAAIQYAGLTFEEQTKIKTAMKMLKTITQEEFDRNEKLRVYVAGNKMLANQYADFLDKWINMGLEAFGVSKAEQEQIGKITGINSLLDDRIKKEQDIATQMSNQLKILKEQQRIGERHFPGAPMAPAGEARFGTGGIPTGLTASAAREAAMRAGLIDTANAGAQQRNRADDVTAQTLARMYDFVQSLQMNNQWTVDYTINVEPEKLAQEINERFKFTMTEQMEKMLPIVQERMRDFINKVSAGEAARRQAEAG